MVQAKDSRDKPEDTKPADTKPAGTKPAFSKPAVPTDTGETTPADTAFVEPAPVEGSELAEDVATAMAPDGAVQSKQQQGKAASVQASICECAQCAVAKERFDGSSQTPNFPNFRCTVGARSCQQKRRTRKANPVNRRRAEEGLLEGVSNRSGFGEGGLWGWDGWTGGEDPFHVERPAYGVLR
jgi:hypothetical protein